MVEATRWRWLRARKVVTSIFKRPLTQVTLGMLAGVVLIVLAN